MGQTSSYTTEIAEKRYESSVTIIRPSNVTGYTALDVIGQADTGTPANAGDAILVFDLIGPPGGHIRITGLDLIPYLAAVTAGMTTFRLHLYDAAPAAILDNAAMDFAAADRAKYLGFIDLAAPTDFGSTIFTQNINNTTLPCLKLAAGVQKLFGVLQTVGAFTPTSGETYKIRLRSSEA
jgi:hypothetical protein